MFTNNKWLLILLSIPLLMSSEQLFFPTHNFTSHYLNTPTPTSAKAFYTEISLQEIQAITKKYLTESPDPIKSLYNDPITQWVVEDFFTKKTKSQEIAETVLLYTTKKKLPIQLVFSLVFVESSFSTKAINFNSSSADLGLFQLNTKTFRHLKQEEFFSPRH